jgi:hypothetical protein
MIRWRAALVRAAAVTLVGLCLGAADGSAQVQPPGDPQLQEARRSFEQLNFDAARDQLSAIIARVPENPREPRDRSLLSAAYELRGRTLQNLRDLDGARADFRAMLAIDPGYPFPPEAGARALALFEEVRAAMVGSVDIAVTPADASVQVDGRAVGRPLHLSLVAGVHALTASHRGHADASQQFEVRAGEAAVVNVTLARVLSSITLQTIPPNVTVLVDGASRGTTLPGPPAADPNSPVGPSQPFVVEELANGRHRIELRRDCFVPEQRDFDFQKPEGATLDVVRMNPATGTINVRSDAAGATVYVDDQPRGEPPQTVTECRGPHAVEVRTGSGRDIRRFDVTPGQKEEFTAVVRPAFAIVTDNDLLKTGGADEGRVRAETMFRDTKQVVLFAPPKPRVVASTEPAQLPADWLAFDAAGVPIKGAASIGKPGLQAASARVSADLGAQGVAAFDRDPRDPQSMLLILLAPRSGRPDVLRWRLNDPDSLRQVVARLDALPSITQASLGLLALDVADVQGVVIGKVESGSGAAAAGLQPGDVITGAGGKPITTVVALLSAVAAAAQSPSLALDVRDRSGAAKKVDVTVQTLPYVIDPLDDSVLSNTLAVSLTARTGTPMPPIDGASLRMNLAVLWMHLENWDAATRELEAAESLARNASIAAGVKDAITANVEYLVGLCAVRRGDATRAEQAFTRAAQSSGALLTDGGEPLKALAERGLADVRAARAR